MKKNIQLNLEFGEKLKSLLKQANETQKTFAEKIGVSENSVFNWCKGENIDLANYVKVLHFFLDNSDCTDMPKLSTNDKVADLLISQFQTSVVTVKEKYVKRLTESNDKLKEERKKLKAVERENCKLKLMQLNKDLTTAFEEWERELEEKTHTLEKKIREYKKIVALDVIKTVDLCKTFNIDLNAFIKDFFTNYVSTRERWYDDDTYRMIQGLKKNVPLFSAVTDLFIKEISKYFIGFFIENYNNVKQPEQAEEEIYKLSPKLKKAIYDILNSANQYKQILDETP